VQDAKQPRTLRWALVGALTEEGMQPFADLDVSHAAVARHLFETPLPAQGAGLLVGVASSPDGALTARLRDGARLSDGTPVRPDMVVDALERSRWCAPLVRVSVRGDTLTFRPRGEPFDIVPLLRDGRVRFGVERGGRWLGTGPYRVRAAGDGCIELEPNPHHPRTVAVERARCVGYGQHDALERIRTDLLERRVDLTEALGREELREIRGFRKVFGLSQSTAMLWLNAARLELPLRAALVRAIDRLRVLSTTYANPLAFLARSVLPPSMGTVRMPDRRDVTAAREAIAGLGLDRPLRMVVIWARRPYLPDPTRWAQDIAAQLADVGVDVELVPTASPHDYQRCLERADYDLVLGGWYALSASPAEFLDAMLHSSMIPVGVETTGCNFGWFRDAEVDGLLQSYRASMTTQGEQTLLEVLDREALVVPLGHGAKTICARWSVEGIEPEHALAIDLSQLRWDLDSPELAAHPD
jgi:hypothetical protein